MREGQKGGKGVSLGLTDTPTGSLWLLAADLHCNNILLKPPAEDGSGGGGWQLKIIDAEKYYYGPAGMDVGQLMANYAYDGPPTHPPMHDASIRPCVCVSVTEWVAGWLTWQLAPGRVGGRGG